MNFGKLSTAICVCFMWVASLSGQIKISELPTTNSPSPISLLQLSAATGGGGWTTRSINISNLVRVALANSGAVVAPMFVLKINPSAFTNAGPATFQGGLTNSGATLLSGATFITGSATLTGPLTNITAASTVFSNITSLGTMTVARDPTADLEVVTKQYADSVAGTGVTNASVIYVQTNGYAIGTAVRGNPNKPFNTVTAAVSQAVSGDVIKLGAGTFYVTGTRVTLPNNVSLVGEGAQATKIVGNAQLQSANQGAMVNPGNNSFIGNLSLISSNEASFAAPLGVYHGINAQTFTNVLVRGVELFGHSDNLYCYSSNLTTITLDSCVLRGSWDNVYSFGHTNSLIQMIGCHIITTNTGVPITSTQTRNFHIGMGRVHIDNCRLEAWGGSEFAANLHVGDYGRVWLNNSSLNGGLAGSYFKITNNSGYISIQSCSINPSEIVGPGNTSWDAHVLAPSIPLASLTNVIMGRNYYITLSGDQTLSLSYNTNIFAKTEIQVYVDVGGPYEISYNDTAWIEDSGGTSPITVNGPTKLLLRAVTNNIHIDWTGDATEITNGLATIAYVDDVARVDPYTTNIAVWSENFSGTLANWQTENGTWSISGGKLLAESTTNFLPNRYLKYTNWTTCAPWWSMSCQFTPQATNGDASIGFGIRSFNDTIGPRNMFFRIIFGDYLNGDIVVYSGTTNLAAVGAHLPTNGWATISPGQPIDVTMTRRGQIFSISTSNTVTTRRSKMSWACSLTNEPYMEPYAGYFTIWNGAGTNTVDNVSFSLNPEVPVNVLCVGNSITTGIGGRKISDCWPLALSRRMMDRHIEAYGCGSMYLNDINWLLPEIALLAPRDIVVLLGDVDHQFSVPVATWKSNYNYFVNNVDASGTIWKCTPTPTSVIDMGVVAEFVITNWPDAQTIDFYGALVEDFPSYAAKAPYAYGDGRHLTSEGYDVMSEIVAIKLRGQ